MIEFKKHKTKNHFNILVKKNLNQSIFFLIASQGQGKILVFYFRIIIFIMCIEKKIYTVELIAIYFNFMITPTS